MSAGQEDSDERAAPPVCGLCAACVHAHKITSAKGSTFVRCDLSFTDGRFVRYPILPVIRCPGYRSPT